MAILLAIFAALIGAAVYGYAMDRKARKELEEDLDKRETEWVRRALESEQAKSDADALEEFRKNFGEGQE